MPKPPDGKQDRAFDSFASHVTRLAGSPLAFGIAVITVIAWAATGPLFHYSDGWQLVINTGTTIVTFLMVFLIQQSQNKDSVALHLKLNELLSSHRAANNQLIGRNSMKPFGNSGSCLNCEFYIRRRRCESGLRYGTGSVPQAVLAIRAIEA